MTLLANIREIFCFKRCRQRLLFLLLYFKKFKKILILKKPAEICTAVCDTVKIKCEFRGGKSVQVATYVIFPFSVFFWVGEGELFRFSHFEKFLAHIFKISLAFLMFWSCKKVGKHVSYNENLCTKDKKFEYILRSLF